MCIFIIASHNGWRLFAQLSGLPSILEQLSSLKGEKRRCSMDGETF